MSGLRLPLPAGYRPADVLALQGRDREQRAERVTADGFDKGLVWHGAPARLRVRFTPGAAEASLDVAGAPAPAEDVRALARHLLGLDQPVEAFEAAHRRHPLLGPVLARQAGLRVPQAATPFEALSWAITGQQISVAAALSLRRRLIDAVGLRHPDGLACYPDAAAVAALDEPRLAAAGLSKTKAASLLAVARLTASGELPLNAWLREGAPADEIRARLLDIRGIGPWTVDYTLLRGFAHLDGSLHGDAAVRRKLQALLGRDTPPGPQDTAAWLAPFAPWRALAAAHLWAS